jgi:hypothetical protein
MILSLVMAERIARVPDYADLARPIPCTDTEGQLARFWKTIHLGRT